MSVERYEEEQADQIATHASASVEVLPQDQAEKAREESQKQKEGAASGMKDPNKLDGVPRPFGRLMAYLWANYKIHLSVVGICIVISGIASAVGAIFLQQIVDTVIIPGMSQGLPAVMSQLVRLVVIMGIIFGSGIVCAFIYTRLMAIVTQGTLKKMRDDMFDRMETLPLKFFDTHPHGAVMSTYTNDTDAIRQLIGQSIPTLIQSALTILALTITMLSYSLWLTLLVAAATVAMFGVTKKMGGGSAKFMVAQQRSLAEEEGYIEEMMDGQKVIKVFNHEDAVKHDFLSYNHQLFNDSERANQYGNMLMPTLGNIGNILYVAVALIGGIMVELQTPNFGFAGMGAITVGVVVSFLGMVRNFTQTLGQASMQVPMIALGLAGASRVFALMEQESEEDEGYVTLVRAGVDENGDVHPTEERTGVWAWRHPHSDGTVTYTRLRGELVMEDVDFSYDGKKTVLHDISLWAKPGQKIAFVGATGAGKTTITNLINRFYDIDDGKIRFDGINIRKIHKPDLRRSLGVVLQDVKLFTGTVMDNIRFGRLDATDEECIAAAKLANAHSFIERLPDGYQTELSGNGSNLSQGQAQLLSIARAAVADPPAMILDEATSSIDTRTESLVQNGMDNLMEGRTVFVIAHRLSTVRNSDAIMVLDHGRIIERGSHDELIAQKGVYYQLYTGAFELE